MFERIGTGWNLVQETWGVLWDDKKLLVFPLLSMLACLAVLARFRGPALGKRILRYPHGRTEPRQ